MTYSIYIGSNNDTKELELSRIEQIMGRAHRGFTLYEAIGYWLGEKERTAVVTVDDESSIVMATIATLKSELNQDAIAFQAVPDLQFA